MVSAFAGVAIIAFPSGIIAAGMITELDKQDWKELERRTARKRKAGQADEADQTDEADETKQVDQTD